ncbi:MAG: hypothetical protein ACP5EK_07185 [Thermoplasmatota archaeon]
MTIVAGVLEDQIKGKTAVQQRIAVFERVRDIPYRLIPALYSPSVAARGTLLAHAGSCTPKHFLLGHWLESMGYQVRYVTFPFHWNAPELQFPPPLRSLARAYPPEYHLALHLLIEGRWTLVDATWDPPLKALGFNVNQRWDGVSDTANAVHPLGEVIHTSPQERDAYAGDLRAQRSPAKRAIADRFTMAFNQWLDEHRTRGGTG